MAQDTNDLSRDQLIISEIEIPKNRIVTRINQQHQKNLNYQNTGLFQDLTELLGNVLEWLCWLERNYQEAQEMQVRVEILRMRLFGLSYIKDEISVAEGTKTNLEQKSENLAREHEVMATSENGDSGSYYQAVDWQLDPVNVPLQSEEPNPGSQGVISQEAISQSFSLRGLSASHSHSALPVNNDHLDFPVKAVSSLRRNSMDLLFWESWSLYWDFWLDLLWIRDFFNPLSVIGAGLWCCTAGGATNGSVHSAV